MTRPPVVWVLPPQVGPLRTELRLMLPGYDHSTLTFPPPAHADLWPCPNPRDHDEHTWVLLRDLGPYRPITCQGQPS